MKEYFTLQEAVTWLSKRSEDDFSSDDILRENEKGRIPVYFSYKGNLGIFSDYSDPISWFFPKPLQRIYFHGTLKSLSVCQLGIVAISSHGNSTKSDILRPHKVAPFETLHSDPDIRAIDMPGTFFGRLRETDGYLDSITTIPKFEWLFHISDLRVISGYDMQERQQDVQADQQANSALLTVIESDPLAESNIKKIDSGPKDWKIMIQAEAARMIIDGRKSGAQPVVHSIIDDLARWCKNNNVRTSSGIFPSAGYIRTHVLSAKHWTTPK